MITYEQLVSENTFYSNEVEKHDFIQDESKVMLSLIYNFFGNIGILGLAENKQSIKQYFKSDKAVRLKHISDKNNNSSLSVKLANDLGFFRTDQQVSNMTRFLAKLKGGQVDEIDIQAFANLMEFSSKGLKALKTNPLVYKNVQEFSNLATMLPDTSMLLSFIHNLKRSMIKEDDTIVGDFKIQIKKAKIPKSEQEKAQNITLSDYAKAYYADDQIKMADIRNDWNLTREDDSTLKNKFDEFESIFLVHNKTAQDKAIKVNELNVKDLAEYFDTLSANKLIEITNMDNFIVSRNKNLNSMIIDAVMMTKHKDYYFEKIIKLIESGSMNVGGFWNLLGKEGTKIQKVHPNLIKNMLIDKKPEDLSSMIGMINHMKWKVSKDDSLLLDKKQLEYIIYLFKKGSHSVATNNLVEGILRDIDRPKLLGNDTSLNKEYAIKLTEVAKDNHPKLFYKAIDYAIRSIAGTQSPGKKLMSELVKLNITEYANAVNDNMSIDEVDLIPESLDATTTELLLTEFLKFPLRYTESSNEDDAKISLVSQMQNKKILTTGNYNKTMNKFLPNLDDKQKMKFYDELLHVNLSASNINVERANETKMNILLNDFNDTLLTQEQQVTLGQELLFTGVFDKITPSQNNELLRQYNEGIWVLFDDLKLLSSTNQERLHNAKHHMIADSIETQPDEVDLMYDESDRGVKNQLKNYFQGWNLLSNQIENGILPSFQGSLERHDMKDVLDYNLLDYKAIYDKTKTQIRKNEKFTDYIKRIERFINEGKLGLPSPKVSELDLNEEQLLIASKEIQSTRNEKHGPNHFKILKSYAVNFPIDKYEEFVELMKSNNHHNPLIPAFTGTSGVGANMILRYGFALLPEDATGVTGKALGQGIYLAQNVDKVQQYLGATFAGSAREVGTKGYIIDMESELGENGVNYEEAGTGTNQDWHPNFISPEWAVKDPEKQLKMMKVHQVELISINTWKALNGVNESMSYKEFLTEKRDTSNKNQITFNFYDNRILLNGNVVEFETINMNNLPKNMKIVKERGGAMVIFTGTKKTSHYDIKYCSSMSTSIKNRYLQLINR